MNVPVDLQPIIGKKELRYSLATGYIGLAKSRAMFLAGMFQQHFRAIRKAIQMGELTLEMIPDLVNEFNRWRLEAVDAIRMMKQELGDDSYHSAMKLVTQPDYDPKKDLREGESLSAKIMTSKWLDDKGIDVDVKSYVYKKFLRDVLISTIKWQEVEERRNQGDYSDNVRSIFPVASDSNPVILSTPAPETIVEPPSILLSELIEEYKKRKIESEEWRVDGIKNHEPKFRAMLQVFGNQPVNLITNDDTNRLRMLLDNLPPYFPRRKEYKDLSGLKPKDIAGKHDKTMDQGTQGLYMNMARAMFSYAEDCGYVTKNPVLKGFVPRKKKGKGKKRLPFDEPDDLNKIFHPDTFVRACIGMSRNRKDYDERFWVPLLLLYTGCRREEICQLKIKDLKRTDDGIWYIKIRGAVTSGDADEENSQMLKTWHSIREVPLHPVLTDELKFPAWVNKIRRKPDGLIFNKQIKKNNKWGFYMGQWFNTRLRTKKVGITDPKKVLHSFRHNVANHLVQEGVEVAKVEALSGRAGKTETEASYTLPRRVGLLYKECVLKLDYGIDLSHLKKSKWVVK